MEHANWLVSLAIYAVGCLVSWSKVYDDQTLSNRMSLSLAWPLVVGFIAMALTLAMLDAMCAVLIFLWKNGVVSRWQATQLKLKSRQRRR